LATTEPTNGTVERVQQLAEDAALLADLEAELLETVGSVRRLASMAEPGWIGFGNGGSADAQIAAQIDRAGINRQARWYYYQDPIASHAVTLHNAYTFGRGASFRAADKDVQAWLEGFWRDARNRASLTRAQAQWALNTDRQLDGELFFVFYVSTYTGRVTVRTLDPSEIDKIVTAPGDPAMPVYFKRVYRPQVFNWKRGEYETGQQVTEYIPDWRNAGPHPPQVHWPANTEIYVMHVVTNPLGWRGLTHLATGLPWIKALKGFMEDRATLTLALATFAFKQKIKGNRTALQRVIQQWGTFEMGERYGLGGEGTERKPAAQTFIENEASSLEQLKTDSGASNAYQDMRMFKQMAGIGAGGIFEHYLGTPEANLATATSMELPMLKMFEFEQQTWEDVLGDILSFVVQQGARFSRALAGKAQVSQDTAGGSPMWVIEPVGDVDLSVTVTLPPIVQRDVAVQSAALASIAQAESMTGQQMVPPDRMAERALTILGFDDVGDIVEEMIATGFTLTLPPARSFGEIAAEAFVRKARARLKEAADEPPDVGDKLPADEATSVEPITRKEVDSYFDAFEDMPELDDLLKSLGLTLEDVEEARRAGSAG